MHWGRWRRFSAKEEAQGIAFAKILATLVLGPLLLYLASHHYEQLSTVGHIVMRGKRRTTMLTGNDAHWLIGVETVLGAVLSAVGIWWARERLRRFPHW